jgi:hypothetical protein
MQIELTREYVIYQAQTRLLELGVEVAEAKKWTRPEIEEKINLGIKIRLWLKALQYYTYLDQSAIERLVYCLANLCNANAIPYAPVITTVNPPAILVGIPGDEGETGAEGPEGGGVPFSQENISIDTVVDSFPISLAEGVDYSISVSGPGGKRIQRLVGGWSSDGLSFGDDGGDGTDDLYGDTSPVTLSVVVSGGITAQLFAQITSGTWTIKGTRKYIPNNGNGITTPTSLTEGKIWIGNVSNTPTAQTISGDITISNAGVAAIATGVIVNADISASAAIALSKLAPLTASRATVTDGGGVITTSATTATQIGYLSNVTSDVQAQLDTKISSASGAISTVVSTNLTASRAVISNALGKIAVSNTTDTELGYVSGVTSAIQTQLNAKLNLSGGTLTGNVVGASGVSLVLNGSGTLSTNSGAFVGGTNGQGGFPGGISTQNPYAPYWKVKIVEIGAWNMDTDASKTVTGLGLSDKTKIRDISVMLVNDSGNTWPLDAFENNAVQGGVGNYTASAVDLHRLAGGTFDTTAWDSTGINRGWITIIYEA